MSSRAGCLFFAFASFWIDHGLWHKTSTKSHDDHRGSHPLPGKAVFLGRVKMSALEVWGKSDRDLEMFSQKPHGSCLSVNE